MPIMFPILPSLSIYCFQIVYKSAFNQSARKRKFSSCIDSNEMNDHFVLVISFFFIPIKVYNDILLNTLLTKLLY